MPTKPFELLSLRQADGQDSLAESVFRRDPTISCFRSSDLILSPAFLSATWRSYRPAFIRDSEMIPTSPDNFRSVSEVVCPLQPQIRGRSLFPCAGPKGHTALRKAFLRIISARSRALLSTAAALISALFLRNGLRRSPVETCVFPLYQWKRLRLLSTIILRVSPPGEPLYILKNAL